MKYLIIIVLFLFPAFSFGQKPQTEHITTHNKITIVTNPAKGNNPYPAWGVFPKKNVSVRKIMMHVTLGSPDSLPTAHWDYLDQIRIRRTGGINGKSIDFELGRMLTPYGSIFNKGWQWQWHTDVTDFSLLLRDSIEIEYNHSGYEPVTVGWKLTIDFEFVIGPEIITPIAVTKVWEGNFKYGDPDTTIGMQLNPYKCVFNKKTGLVRFRIQHTGHGMDQPKGCSEFCSRWRDIFLDGNLVSHVNLWKNCGDNPLYPQGGTWIYDRAWWCPGYLQPADITDMIASPGSHSLSIEMEPYTATGDKGAKESIASYMIEYMPVSQKNDVAVEEILVPSNNPQFNRLNPAGFNPRIKFRNLGSEPLTSVQIEYGTNGFSKKTYLWTGKLEFNAVADVVLPGMIQSASGLNTFTVKLIRPNGKKDAWEHDNTLTSSFDAVPILPVKMILQFRTNNKPSENKLIITDKNGKEIYSKTGKTLKPATLYTDTLSLSPENYALMLSDSAGDGLEFWYEADAGYGYLRLLDMNGRLIKNFESDCGDGMFYSFATSGNFVTDTTSTQYSFILFPRMAKDQISLDVHADISGKMEIKITADGELVENHVYNSVRQNQFTYNLNHLKPGRYIFEVLMNGESKFKRRFNKI